MLITDYERVANLVEDNVFLLDGPKGTKSITAKTLGKALAEGLNLSEFTQVNVADSGDKVLLGLQGGGQELFQQRTFCMC